MENAKNVQKIKCYDCKKEIKIKGKEIVAGVRLVYDNQGSKKEIFKCKKCFEKDKSLRNYQPCEVYSRVVGYLRPVRQWNLGKQKEFHQRKEYKIPKVAKLN